MDSRLSALKENQQLLGCKISMLQENNRKKDEEAERIRELIAECKENLNRIKCEAMNSKTEQKGKGCKSENRSPCPDKGKASPCPAEDPCAKHTKPEAPKPCGGQNEDYCAKCRKTCCGQEEDPCAKYRRSDSPKPCPAREEDPCAKYRRSDSPKSCGSREEDPCAKYRKSDSAKPCGAKEEDPCAKYRRSDSPKPCPAREEDPCAKYRRSDSPKSCGSREEDPCAKYRKSDSPKPCGGKEEDPCAKYRRSDSPKSCASREEDPCAKYRRSDSPKPCGGREEDPCAKYRKPDSAKPCGDKEEDPCAKYLRPDPPKPKEDDHCGKKSTPKQCSCLKEDPCAKYLSNSTMKQEDPCAKYLSNSTLKQEDPCQSITSKIASQVSAIASAQEKSRECIDKLGERIEREVKMKILSANLNTCAANSYSQNLFDMSECEKEEEVPYEERVSCKVDLNKMKVNVKGCPEDLKKLDAVQLINLLDRFQCQELVISTGQSSGSQVDDSTGEVPVFYITHPGNLALVLGIVMVAFLINANLCSPHRSCRARFLLNMLYLASFAFHYGIVLWMTFIRGFTLSLRLSREIFHAVDNLILPKYFSISVFLSAITLYSFLATHCAAPCTSWPLPVLVQVIIESATFLLELIAICYLVPAIIKLREATDEYLNEDDECPPPESYCRNMEKLTKLGWTICLVNTLTVVFMGSNMYYMSSKLHLG